MELNNEIDVNAPIQEVWDAFNTPERIAPCLPGAELEEVDGNNFNGLVKIKVGPITAQYKGTASYLEKDEEGQKVVIKGDGRDTRGAGNASATITAQLSEVSAGITNVNVRTELTITGKVAQFGRGAISDVSGKLMTQFAQNLEKLLESTEEIESTETDGESIDSQTTDSELNLLSVVAIPILKRFGIPIAALAVAVFMVIRYAIL
ncbi:MAG: carbon monoxide dehydrogenase [Acidimicrobiaceae bacterium]|jgi:carbon monoxide dehydrogenase subunit G|nr:carbon monoxide dehydrogenase [Acidimicrobiaceae bacterium]|tara:strand:+ start:61360 stop:61977 length:618 start_codon:yes stop_codon:yes gene_type:complete